MTLRAAIIGCGQVAGGYDVTWPRSWSLTHAGAYALCADTTLVAAADPDAAARDAFGERWGLSSLYPDHQTLLEAEEIDLVSIAAPTRRHASIFADVLAAGPRGVWLEKPLSYDLAEAEAMCAAGGSCPVAVNYFRRWNSTIVDLVTRVRGGEYGPVVHLTCYYTKGVVHNATHAIDLALWLLGTCRHVELLGGASERAGTLAGDAAASDDAALDFRLTFDGDIRADFIAVDGVTYRLYDLDLVCERARVQLTQRGRELSTSLPQVDPITGGFDVLAPATTIETDWRACSVRAVTDLVRSARDGGLPACTLADALAALRVACHVRDARVTEER